MTIPELSQFAIQHFGIPYQFGGELATGEYGIDCSGFARRIAKKGGINLPGDQTADMLYRMWNRGPSGITEGAFAFFGTPSLVTHVGYVLSQDLRIMISAAGGGMSVVSAHIAKSLGASVKIQPISWYNNFVGAYMPPYPFLQK